MIPVSGQPAVLIAATEHRRETALRRGYLLRSVGVLWHVEEISSAGEQPPFVRCSFVLGPQGYNGIRLSRKSADLLTGLSVSLPSKEQVDGSSTVGVAGLPKAQNALLCDGPNPLFNYFNAMHLLGITPGEERSALVHVCDTLGSVREEHYSYFFDGTTITVRKSRNGSVDILELDSHCALRRIVSDTCEVVVSRYTPVFLN